MVIRVRYWLCLIVLLLCSTTPFAATINAEVDRSVVQEDESFYLTFSSDTEVDGDPNFSVLEKDFRILNRSQSSNIQIIGGQMSREMKWQLMLMPKRGGLLTIPSVAFGDDKSNTVQLKAVAAKPSQGGKAKDLLYMETDVDRQTAYVQSQIIYTIRIYHALALNLINASLSDLTINDTDAIVEKLIDNKSYEKIVDGKRYKVFEKKFALFPQKSGKLIIEPTVFEGQYVDRRRTLHTKRLRSKPIDIDIQPIPNQHIAAKQGAWLPTPKLQLSEKWPDKITEIKVGEPITRTLTIVAEGLMSSQLPEMNKSKEINDIKQYADQPNLDDDKSSQGFIARREEKIAYIPSKSGPVTLPSIEIPWWNTEKNIQEYARVPSRTIEVVSAAGLDEASRPTDISTDASAAGNDNVIINGTDLSHSFNSIAGRSIIWFWVSVALLIAWCITLLGWRLSLRRANNHQEMQLPRSGVNHEKIKVIVKKLKTACQRNEPNLVKALLLDWARQQWPDHPPMSIGAIAVRVDGVLAKELFALNDALYSEEKNHWRGEPLWQAIQQLDVLGKQPQAPEKTVIAPLFKIVTADT